MSKIFITRKLPGEAINLLKEAGHEVLINNEDRVLEKGELISIIKEFEPEALLSLLTDTVDKEVMDAAPNLKIISNYAVGFNNIDVEEAKKRGIIVTNTPGVLSEAVAEHTMALIISLAKRIVESDKFVRDGKYIGWAPELLLGTELQGRTLGLLGAGRIGSLVAESANKGFRMNVLYYDIKRNDEIEKLGAVFKETPEALLAESDFVSIHVPLLDSTKHLINKERIEVMKNDAFLINTSRGPVVDEKALVEALKTGKIKGAGLDVFENEPALAEGLVSLPNVILTPHTASATLETRSKMADLAVGAIIDFLSGVTPINLVT
jgi:glyoxylate reductase